MNSFLNICSLILLIACVCVSSQAGKKTSGKSEDDPRCDAFQKKTATALTSCRVMENEDATIYEKIDQTRCLWNDLKIIDIVADNVKECEKRYPDDSGELLCGLQVMYCSLERVIEQCPSLKENDKQ